MKCRLLVVGAVALAIALLFIGGRSAPAVHADPFTTSYDLLLFDAPPTGCGNNDGVIDPGECPLVRMEARIDTRTDTGTLALQEPFFDQAITFWSVGVLLSTGTDGFDIDGDTVIEDAEKNALYPLLPPGGLGATPGAAINKGAQTGEVTFSIKSNVRAAPNNNICLAAGSDCSTSVGQPPPISSSTSPPPGGGQIQETFKIFNAELSTAAPDLISYADLDSDGLRQTENDQCDASGTCSAAPSGPGSSPNANGVRDGVDLTPEPFVEFYNELSLPNHTRVARYFGTAKLLEIFGNVATQDVNFVVFSGAALGSAGYFSFMLIGYPWVAAKYPSPLTGSKLLEQAVDMAPPFVVTVDTYGVTQDNNAELDEDYDGTVDTDGPDIDGGEISRRTFWSDWPYDYLTYFSSSEDYDNDGLAAPYDYCDLANIGILTYAGQQTADSDGDNMIGICDINGEGTNPADGTAGTHSDCPDDSPPDGECDTGFGGWNDVLSKGQDFDQDDPTGDWNGDGCAGICGVDDDGDTSVDEGNAADDDEDGTDDEGNWVGDGIINAQDNCPQLPDIDIDGDTLIDFQLDTDGDGMGDLCDRAPGIPGDDTGSSSDNDNVCADSFTFPAVEGTGDGACKTTGVHGMTDADDDGQFDLFDWDNNGYYAPGEYDADSNSDNPSQGRPVVLPYTNDTGDYASDACEVFVGTDPKVSASNPVGGTFRGFLIGGTADFMDCDGDTIADENDSMPFPTGPGGIDSDGDGCSDWEELGPDKTLGGLRDPLNPYDFFDVPFPPIDTAGATALKNRVVFGEDLSAILWYGGVIDPSPGVNNPVGSGTPNGNGAVYDDDNNGNGIEDGLEYDYYGGMLFHWQYGPNGAIFGEDLSQVLIQGGDDCTAPP